ncbi:MAG: sodium:proton exchanger [Bacteroidetes bacterium 4572_77]|nr:MAG: sodium:proton exchanger [Bacteroidetes bacterium 4572_77]
MGQIDSYILLIGIGAIIVLSYLYDLLSLKLKVPSVLFLISTGIALQYIDTRFLQNIHLADTLLPTLEILGMLGMIMIVLEAALDLEITKNKIPLIRNSFFMALIVLIISSLAIALIIMNVGAPTPFFNSLIYAIPLSVVSSAVLIPSVHNLTQNKKEYMTYEATFSDIIGIMFFNFIVIQGGLFFSIDGLLMIIMTIGFSLFFSVVLVMGATKLRANLKLFLVIALLCILYAVGKKMHLSPLLMIFIFGLILNNGHKMTKKINYNQRFIENSSLKKLKHDFKIITGESSFLMRTCFFVIFGMSINLRAILEIEVIVVGSIIVILLYLIRFINFKLFIKTDVFPEVFLAPRGLITILLFYQIPAYYQIESFSVEILSFVIIVTGLVMSLALIFTPSIKAEELTVIDIGLAPVSEDFD